MGDERRSQLHGDIEDYLHQRHKKSPPEQPGKEMKFSMETYENTVQKPSFWSKVKGWFTHKPIKEEDLPPLEQEEPVFKEGEPEPMSEEKRGFFKQLMAFFVKQEQILEEVQEAPPEKVEEAKEDLRELAKLFLKTLERLPDDELKEFKETPEFIKFKDILRKHKVIK